MPEYDTSQPIMGVWQNKGWRGFRNKWNVVATMRRQRVRIVLCLLDGSKEGEQVPTQKHKYK